MTDLKKYIEKILHIQPDATRITVGGTGGAETTIILYMLCKYYEDRPDVDIYVYTCNKTTLDSDVYTEGTQAHRMMVKMAEYTSKQPYHLIKTWGSKQSEALCEEHGLSIWEIPRVIEQSYAKEVVEKFDIHAYYSGWNIMITPNQWDALLQDFPKESRGRLTDHYRQGKPVRGYTEQFNDTCVRITPFVSWTKDKIVKVYKDLGVIDLYKETTSCPDNLEPCFGKCEQKCKKQFKFNCIERVYAERFNGIE